MTSATLSSSPSDLDERILAQSALDAAEDNLQSLCASHAGTFVQVERRGKALQQGLADLLQHLAKVQQCTVEAQDWLRQDEDGGEGEDGQDQQQQRLTLAQLAENHRVRRRTLLQHSSLLELLELPSLMDACVRSNLYDEALSIAGLANTLQRRSSSGVDNNTENNNNNNTGYYLVVQQVVEQIRQRQEDLRQQLWQRLSQASVTLPDCLEVVTALRRLNAIDLERSTAQNLEAIHAGMEVQLQIDFLEARDVWLETTTTSSTRSGGGGAVAATPGHAEDLLDTMERYRTRVFEIATQFNAIFRANLSSSASAKDDDSSIHKLSSLALLRLWMTRRVETFLQILAGQLHTNVNETSHLRDALEAALFFATSLGRLGADFTGRLPALFEPVLVQIVTASWNDGAKLLAETLVTCREAGIATPLSTGLTTETMEANPPTEGSNNADEEGQPLRSPRMLLNYPPMARFVNAILLGLNELRRCLLPGVVGRLQESLGALLHQVHQDLVAHERAVHVPGLAKGPHTTQLRQLAVTYKELLTTIIEPYAWGSLYAALGNVAAAQAHYQILQVNLQPPQAEEEGEEKANSNDDDEKSTKGEEEGTAETANVQDGQEEVEEKQEGDVADDETPEEEDAVEQKDEDFTTEGGEEAEGKDD